MGRPSGGTSIEPASTPSLTHLGRVEVPQRRTPSRQATRSEDVSPKTSPEQGLESLPGEMLVLRARDHATVASSVSRSAKRRGTPASRSEAWDGSLRGDGQGPGRRALRRPRGPEDISRGEGTSAHVPSPARRSVEPPSPHQGSSMPPRKAHVRPATGDPPVEPQDVPRAGQHRCPGRHGPGTEILAFEPGAEIGTGHGEARGPQETQDGTRHGALETGGRGHVAQDAVGHSEGAGVESARARDAEAAVAEARQPWTVVSRPGSSTSMAGTSACQGRREAPW